MVELGARVLLASLATLAEAPHLNETFAADGTMLIQTRRRLFSYILPLDTRTVLFPSDSSKANRLLCLPAPESYACSPFWTFSGMSIQATDSTRTLDRRALRFAPMSVATNRQVRLPCFVMIKRPPDVQRAR